jgi:hypothetical protein
MRLRASLLGAIVMMLASAGMAGLAYRVSALHSPLRHDVVLVYVGADDCLPCRKWQLEARPLFRAAPEFAAVTYREVKSSTLLDLLADEYWPDELRAYRDLLGRDAGVPLWLIISDNQLLQRSAGIAQWQSTVLPKLRSLLR